MYYFHIEGRQDRSNARADWEAKPGVASRHDHRGIYYTFHCRNPRFIPSRRLRPNMLQILFVISLRYRSFRTLGFRVLWSVSSLKPKGDINLTAVNSPPDRAN